MKNWTIWISIYIPCVPEIDIWHWGEGVHHWLNPPTQTKDQFHSCCKIHSSKFENKIKSSWSILSKNWKCLDSFKEIHYAYDTSQYISSNEKHYLHLVESHSHWFALIPPLMLKKHTVCTGLTNEMLKLWRTKFSTLQAQKYNQECNKQTWTHA